MGCLALWVQCCALNCSSARCLEAVSTNNSLWVHHLHGVLQQPPGLQCPLTLLTSKQSRWKEGRQGAKLVHDNSLLCMISHGPPGILKVATGLCTGVWEPHWAGYLRYDTTRSVYYTHGILNSWCYMLWGNISPQIIVGNINYLWNICITA